MVTEFLKYMIFHYYYENILLDTRFLFAPLITNMSVGKSAEKLWDIHEEKEESKQCLHVNEYVKVTF